VQRFGKRAFLRGEEANGIALVTSLWLATTTAVLLVAISIPLAYFIVWRPSALVRAGNALLEIGYALPGTIVGLAADLLFIKPIPLLGFSLYGTPWIILAAYLSNRLGLPAALAAQRFALDGVTGDGRSELPMTSSRSVVEPRRARDVEPPLVTAVSGIGGKLPACFLVEANGKRLLLDLGEGPEPGVRPDPARLPATVDAILVSHAHEDHANALDMGRRLGSPPTYATAETWALLPDQLVPQSRRRLLPMRGTTEILGIPVTTGRPGHAPGAVWIHLAAGAGLFYTGDYTEESLLYPADPLPAAGTAIVDASYGDHDVSLDAQIDEIAALARHGAVLPVPEGGRGPEMALRLVECGLPVPYLCGAVRRQTERILSGEDGTIGTKARQRLSAVFADGFRNGPDTRIANICADSNCATGESAELLRTWGSAVPLIFTGHVPKGTPAETLLSAGAATWHRWNVHPRRSDVVSLVRRTEALRVFLAFVERGSTPTLQRELGGENVVWEPSAPL